MNNDLAEIVADDTDATDLLAKSIAFDALAEELDFDIDTSIEPPRVKVEEGVESMAQEDEVVRIKFLQLLEMKKRSTIDDQEFRFNLARLAAAHKLLEASDNIERIEDDKVKDALQAFMRAGRLGTSAVDILASAILLPLDNFLGPCFAANHNIRILAGKFDLPKGAIALRQEVYHSVPGSGENVNDGGASAI